MENPEDFAGDSADTAAPAEDENALAPDTVETEGEESPKEDLPPHVLGIISKLKRKHQKDVMQRDARHEAQMQQLQGMVMQQLQPQQQQWNSNQPQAQPSFSAPQAPGNVAQMGGNGGQLQDADSIARQQRELAERHAELHEQLEKGADKYDDFYEVIQSPHALFTKEMIPMAMLLPNGEDVLYALGKDRATLRKLGSLSVAEQGKEMVRLSHSLAASESSSKKAAAPTVISQVKTTPSSQGGLSANPSFDELRAHLKKGNR